MMTDRYCRYAAALTLLLWPTLLAAQATGTVLGRVIDSTNGGPLPGAQVTVIGSTRSATTNDRGEYRLPGLPAGALRLRALRIGYAASQQAVALTPGGEVTADFTLAPTIVRLDELVATATGEEQRRRESGATIGTLNVDSLPLAATSNASDVLSARIPGVSVQVPGGTTGTGSRIRIRGSNSVSLSNDPLVMVDGVRVNNSSLSEAIGTGEAEVSRINDINPEDIADVEVIKGPGAAALYGTAAANGVIQITTKRGREGKTRFQAFGEVGSVHQVATFPANFAQIGTLTDGTRTENCTIPNQSAELCTPILDSLASFNPLEQVSPFVTGDRVSSGLSVSGGTNNTTYYVSGGYAREEGVYSTNRLRDVNVRANLRGHLRNNLDVTVSSGYLDSRLARPQNGDNLQGIIIGGVLGSAFDNPETRGYFFTAPDKLLQLTTEQRVRHFTGSLSANYLPFSWLTLTGVGGVDYVNREDAFFIAPGVFTPDEEPDLAVGQRALAPFQIFNYTANANAAARYALRPNLQATSTLGVQYNRVSTHGSTAFGQNLAPGTQSLNGATSLFSVGETNEGLATLGYLAQQQFAWRDRLFLTGAIRTDRNSAFGTNFQRVYYPGASLSWVIGEEPFFPQGDAITSLRLRAAYGTSGQNPEFRQAITFFTPTPVIVGGTEQPGVFIGGTGNANLKPEKSTEFEAGFDAALFNDRVGAEFTVYRKTTDDALIAQNLALSIGTTLTRFINLGKVRNTGVELLLTGRVIDTRPVRFELTLNGSTTHNTLLDLGAGTAPIIFNSGMQRHQTGFPLGGYWGQALRGFADADGDGIIEATEITLSESPQYLGTPFPTRQLAVTPTLTLFDNIRISALFDHRGGQKLFNFTQAARCGFFGNCRAIQDRTAPLEDQAAAVAASELGTLAGYIEDASFTKLREVSVTLTAPERWAGRLGLSALSLTLAGRNLHTWTDYKGTDPEINIFNDNFFTAELVSQPQVRYYTARFNLTW